MGRDAVITLPYRFDTSSVWHTILKGAFALNALLLACILFALLMSRQWTAVLGLGLIEAVALGFTRVFVKFQEGSVGTLTAERVVVEPNVLLGIALPGPRGTYTLDRFSGVRVEFRSGPARPDVQGGPHELVWLAGKPGTPDIVLARTTNGEGRAVGAEFGALVRLPVVETGAPREIRL